MNVFINSNHKPEGPFKSSSKLFFILFLSAQFGLLDICVAGFLSFLFIADCFVCLFNVNTHVSNDP